MKAAGVIVEYNPFHNGHLYHLQQSREVTNADCIVAVMSGFFLQRGEPALVSKWTRTQMALLAGVDLVIELPYAFSTQKAELFANGAVSILEGLGVNEVSFGSESGDLRSFIQTVNVMKEHEDDFNRYLQLYIRKGNSFPKSASHAFQSLSIDEDVVDLSLPNNILGYHYVKAIHDQQAKIKPKTITRTGSNYHDEHFQSPSVASATSIRKALFSSPNTIDKVQQFVPETTFLSLVEYKNNYQLLHQWENYFQLLKYKILTSSAEELASIYEMEEGLEHRFISNIKDATSFYQFMETIKTKRYTWTRLQRACTHVLTNTTKDVMKRVTADKKATYIRLLGMSQTGRTYLQKNKKEFTLPVISKLASFSNEMLQLDIKAAHTYGMVLNEPTRSSWLHSEYSTPPLQYNEIDKQFM
jgi:predicted nucleotidyltransferase